MYIIYGCSYCDKKFTDKGQVTTHEYVCDKSPKNNKCFSCVRFLLQKDSFNLYVCTKYGINHSVLNREDCPYYIEDLDKNKE